MKSKPFKVDKRFKKTSKCVYYSGDCMKFLDTLPDNYVKLIVTSPPYNLGKEYEKKTSLDKYLKNQTKVIESCAKKLRGGGVSVGRLVISLKMGM